MNPMENSIRRMAKEIASVVGEGKHLMRLYGSVVMDDFRLGWSDIDFIFLAGHEISEEQAERLVMLRQLLLQDEPENAYYRSFEGIITGYEKYSSKRFRNVVYWGTSGQRITDRFELDAFCRFELARYGKDVLGTSDRGMFSEPERGEMISAVRAHYESIRKYAVQTNEHLYSCGWLLDISRCIYTLRYNDVIAKTNAGSWAIEQGLFEDDMPLKQTLEIRKNPMAYRDREEVKQWLRNLGPVVQKYADVLERELKICDME